jgi:hypothetical protein
MRRQSYLCRRVVICFAIGENKYLISQGIQDVREHMPWPMHIVERIYNCLTKY